MVSRNLAEHVSLARRVYDELADNYEQLYPVRQHRARERVNRLNDYVVHAGRALDVGCGPGLVLRALIDAGFHATGIDVSPRMVEFARLRAATADVRVGDFLSSEFGAQFDVVIADAFLHLYPHEAAAQIFERLLGALSRPGVISCSTTVSARIDAGFTPKADYPGSPIRYRTQWTVDAFRSLFESAGVRIVDSYEVRDNNKVWQVVSGVHE
ncbi:hypothetical protein DDE19_26025 [Micromonospora ureilytica]|uniref:Methyltransferase domain-containing protein n=1 Tax=Micromonospora ureilytica TaxID=709868 RepID=A0A3N9XK94_9ACTN|nr:class I SAM-dependent methyltransferase [Micromonospora ureilytica]RQX13400.1 hypothetical protein DDE19_26025 [Micromonospora ureilytica]